MFVHKLYLYSQKVPQDYLNQVADIVNDGIIEFNSEYNDSIQVNYTADRVKLNMRTFKMNLSVVVDTETDKVIAVCYQYLLPKTAFNEPFWLSDEKFPVLLNSFIVIPEYRGKGIGTFVLEKLKEYYEGTFYDTLILKTDKPNEFAINLYKKSGYSIKTSFTDENGHDKIIMVLKLKNRF